MPRAVISKEQAAEIEPTITVLAQPEKTKGVTFYKAQIENIQFEDGTHFSFHAKRMTVENPATIKKLREVIKLNEKKERPEYFVELDQSGNQITPEPDTL